MFVVVEVQTATGAVVKLHNVEPKQMHADIDHKPPGPGNTYESPETIPLLDENGTARGCVGQDLVSMEIRSFPADAVIVASGGCGLIYGRSTMSMVCTGSAASRCFSIGARYGNPEFIQVHPTAIPGADKLRLMSESARGEGGRVWVPRKPQDARDPLRIPMAKKP